MKQEHKHSSKDIVEIILDDHKALKKLVQVMKDSDKDLSERKKAFQEFAPLLLQHAKPEEQSWYLYMKKAVDMREEGFEGDVEHGLADQLVEEIKRTEDEDQVSARIKVLAELVEHHIEEEEEEQLPEFKKNTSNVEREQLGELYMQLQSGMPRTDAPRESQLRM